MAHKIGVVGSFIRDTIVTLDQQEIESIGGLYHTMAYLAALAAPGTTLHPLCYVGADFHQRVIAALSQFGPHVQFDKLLVISRPNTSVTLIYRDKETREEFTSQPMPELKPGDLAALADMELVLINLISGPEIDFAALSSIKQRPRPPLIYLDMHSWLLGIDEQGRRYYRSVSGWREWLQAVDFLQINEQEAATLGNLATVDTKALIEFGRSLAADYVKACHITLGSRGSLLFVRDGQSATHQFIESAGHVQSMDIIGCGDAFGAAFVTHFLESSDFVAATRFANQVAGLNCTFMGSLTRERFEQYVAPFLAERGH